MAYNSRVHNVKIYQSNPILPLSNCHDIIEILLKVALNTTNPTLFSPGFRFVLVLFTFHIGVPTLSLLNFFSFISMPVPSHNFTHLSIGAHGWELKETYNKHIIIFFYSNTDIYIYVFGL